MSQSEQELTKAILERLNLMHGVMVWRNNVGASKSGGRYVRYGKVGSGDIMGIIAGGKHVELEVKLPDGKWIVTPDQALHGRKIMDLGGVWAVVKSVDEAVTVVSEALIHWESDT